MSTPQPEATKTEAGKNLGSWSYLYRDSMSTTSMNADQNTVSPTPSLTIMADQTQVYSGASVQLTGTLTDSLGQPVVGATVSAYQVINGTSKLMKSSTTDLNGNYLIVCYGTWYFGNWGSGQFTWFTKSNGAQSDDISITVLAGVPNYSLTIKADQTSVCPGARVNISGTLTDSSAKPVVGDTVSAYQVINGTARLMKSAVTDSSGEYLMVCYGTWYFGNWGCGSFTWYAQDRTSGVKSSNLTIVVNQAPAPTPIRGASEYSGVVYMTFTTSSYSVSAINSALALCPSGQAVKLAAGVYTLNGIITVPSGKVLAGSTDGKGCIATIITTTLLDSSLKANGYINIGSGKNTVMNIKTQNGYYFFGLNSHDFVFKDCEYNGPTDIAAGQFSLYGFFIYIANNGNYDNGCFLRCVVKNSPTFGFLVCADGTKSSNHNGANAYSSHGWSWTDCQAYGCGVANINYPNNFVYGCGWDLFEGFGLADPVVGVRITNCIANGCAADGFHIEYRMEILDCVFKNCTANNNGQWFKLGHTTNPPYGLLIGTGFYLGGAVPSQTKVLNCLAQNNWGYTTRGGGYGMFDSQMHTDLDGTYIQGTGATL